MRKEHEIKIKKEECIKCNLCVKDCLVKAIEVQEDGATFVGDMCIKCGHCVAVCPKNIISMTNFEDDIVEITEDMRIEPEKLLNHIKTRRSVRQFTDEKVAKEDILKLIQAGQYSPTGTNSQNVSYAVLTKNISNYEIEVVNAYRKMKKIGIKFYKALDKFDLNDNFLFQKAPLVIVIKSSSEINGTIAASNIELMAHSLGLGAYYSGMFSKVANKIPKVRRELK